jgi:hypothetical protein
MGSSRPPRSGRGPRAWPLLPAALVWVTCNPSPRPPATEARLAPATAIEKGPPRFPGPHTLLLAQAQFAWEKDAEGKESPHPGAAKLVMLTREADRWRADLLEDPESVVFHKAACVAVDGEQRVLTISSREALLKLWRVDQGRWVSETLWHPRFGGEHDRLRDFELGDVDGDGRTEIVVATHDQGVVAVLERGDSDWAAMELSRTPETFVHEVEIGDLDGDGRTEIYATPSHPNQANQSQPGQLVAFRFDRPSGSYRAETIVDLAHSHIKEILVTDLDRNGKDELYAIHEASRGTAGDEVLPVEIREYRRLPTGSWDSSLVAALPGAVQARVLLDTDLIRSGKRHLLVTTLKGGIWLLTPPAPGAAQWSRRKLGAESSGVEHAAGIADLDGDGLEEVYVSAENRRAVYQLAWAGRSVGARTIYNLPGRDLTWSLLPCAPSAL